MKGFLYARRAPDPFGGKKSFLPWFQVVHEASPGVASLRLDFLSNGAIAERLARRLEQKEQRAAV